MATKKKTPVETPASSTIIDLPAISGIDPSAIASVATQSHTAAKNYSTLVSNFTIQGPEAFKVMDKYLFEIRAAQRLIDNLFNNPETGLIRPIRVGLDRLYALQRNLLAPLNLAETTAKEKMGAYELAEKRKKDEKDRIERERLAKIQAELDANRKADEPQFRVSSVPSVNPGAVRADHSSTSFVKKVRVVSVPQLIEAIEVGLVPEHIGWSLIDIDTTILNLWMKTDPASVESCPGLEVYDDAQIRGKRA